MSKKPSQFYALMYAGNFLEDHPEIMSYERLEDQGFNQFLYNKGKPLLNVWPQDVTVYLSGNQNHPIDFFLCGLGFKVFSKSAAEIISSVAKDSVELLPVKAVLNDVFIGMNSYYVLNVLKSCEALNWEATLWSSHDIPYEDPYAHMRIIKPAFNKPLIGEEHIFLLSVNKKIRYGVFFSKHLKELLEKRKCTVGMEFMPIKTIDTDSLV